MHVYMCEAGNKSKTLGVKTSILKGTQLQSFEILSGLPLRQRRLKVDRPIIQLEVLASWPAWFRLNLLFVCLFVL